MTTSLTAQIAGFADASLSVDEDALGEAQETLLHVIDLARSGRRTEPHFTADPGWSTVWWSDQQFTPTTAASINATAARSRWSDSPAPSGVDATAVAIVAATLALAEHLGKQSGEVITAVAAGLAAASRISLSPAEDARPDALWDLDALKGHLVATISVARLAGLDTQMTVGALGLTGTQATGFAATRERLSGALQAGIAARNAIEACLLAHDGFTAPSDILEGRRGLCETTGVAIRVLPTAVGYPRKASENPVASRETGSATMTPGRIQAVEQLAQGALSAKDLVLMLTRPA